MQKITFINDAYKRFYKAHRREVDKAISKCLSEGNLMFGSEMEQLENNFAKFCKKKYCVTFGSGTDAINASITAILKSKPQTKFIKQNYLYRIPFVQHSTSMRMSNGAMDLDILEKELIYIPNAAVIVTYMNSVQPDIDRLKTLKEEHNFILLEDACQAAGRQLIGDLSCFSFYPAKIFGGMGMGGAVVSDNKELIEQIKSERNEKFNNLWLDEVKCAFLNIKLKYLKTEIKQRQLIANCYNSALSKINELEILSKKQLQNYIIITEQQEKLIEYLIKNGIEVFTDKNSFYDGNLENAMRLPIHGYLKLTEAKYVVKTIKEFFKQ